MGKVGKATTTRRAPAQTPEARENQLIALAMDKVEERMLAGKASAQEYVYFLKLGSTKAQLELEKIKQENELIRAKKENLESLKKQEELYTEAITAMRSYAGVSNEPDDPDEIVLGID